MKYYRRIYINEPGFPSDLYAEFVRLSPESSRPGVFMLEAQPGDEERGQLCVKIAALCEQRGLKMTAGTPGTYGYTIGRHYDAEDLLAAHYFMVWSGSKMFKDHKDKKKRDEIGRITLPATQATQSVTLASIFPRLWIVVSDPVRRLFEINGLVGLQFGETVLKGSSINAASHPFWELKSSIILPKMANSVIQEDRGNFVIYDLPHIRPEPHYHRSELASLGHFDIAYTFESRGLDYHDSPLIISQRFYQCCVQHRIGVEVTPVRIDPD